jgi:hypothetical protein
MAAKIGGKLVAIDAPRVALVAHGRLDERWNSVADEGWTLVVRGVEGVRSEHFGGLSDLFSFIRLLA